MLLPHSILPAHTHPAQPPPHSITFSLLLSPPCPHTPPLPPLHPTQTHPCPPTHLVSYGSCFIMDQVSSAMPQLHCSREREGRTTSSNTEMKPRYTTSWKEGQEGKGHMHEHSTNLTSMKEAVQDAPPLPSPPLPSSPLSSPLLPPIQCHPQVNHLSDSFRPTRWHSPR